MKIYIQNTEKETLKSIPYSDIYKARYNNGEYTKLFPSYDSTLHTITIADAEPTLSNYELYLKGEYTLGEGEYIESESIAKAVKPSSYYEWDYENLEFTISDDNLTAWKVELKSELATLKYTKQESATVSSENLTNSTASYNYLMLKEAIETYEEGIPVRWTNLDDTKFDISDDLYTELVSLRTQTRTHYQACFNAKEDIENIIDDYSSDEMLVASLTDLWAVNYSS